MTSVIRTQLGFSLIELLVAVSVLAILMAVAVPSFTDFIERSRVKGAADEVVSLVAGARGEAVKRGRDVTVAMGGTTSAWCVGANEAATPAVAAAFATSAACDCTVATACLVDGGRRVVAGSDYNGVSVSAATASLTFDGKLGNVSGLASTTVDFSSSKYQVRLTVSPLGQTRVCIPTGQRQISGYQSC